MTPRSLIAGALAAVALGPAVAAAGAAVPEIEHRYVYRAQIEGVQTTTWTLNHVGAGWCDADQTGSGKEVIRFSSKPKRIWTFDGIELHSFFSGKPGSIAEAKFPLKGTVDRSGSITTGPPVGDVPCAGGDGTGETPQPDCGRRPISGLTVMPQYAFRKDLIVLEQQDAAAGPQYKNCPGSSMWPYLLSYEGSRQIGQRLPFSDLYNQGINIVIARGTHKTTGEYTSTTRIRWSLKLTRLKKEKL